MQELTQVLKCEIKGFEAVTLTYNLMATPEKLDLFVRRMGQSGSHEGIIVGVDGWPTEEYGPNPWDSKRVPSVWFAWASKKGWALAMKAYLEDPNS